MSTKSVNDIKVGDKVSSLGAVKFNEPMTCVRTNENKAGKTTVIFWHNGGFFPTHGNSTATAEITEA